MAELTADIVTRCRVRRGSFTIPGRLFEDGREGELAYFFATHMPEGRRARPSWGKPDERGDVLVKWRIVDVVRVR